MFYGGANWLITMRRGLGYKRKVCRFQITRAWYLSDRFHGSFSVKDACGKVTLKESLNLVPRVFSYPSLRHSIGMGRREPWERGWESPFSLLLILRLSAPVSWLKLVNDLGEIKGVGVKMRGDLSTVGHCLELANPVQIFFDGCEDKKRFSSRVVVSFTVVFRYAKVTRKAAKI